MFLSLQPGRLTTQRGKFRFGLVLAVAALGSVAPASVCAQGLNADLETAMKQAVKTASPSVVQIVTSGGTDLVVTTPKGPSFRKALGPTTGVIISSDGYIISSAFNFINDPSSILVAVPGHAEPFVAKLIATDRSRMLTLLKINKSGLPVPKMVPESEISEGQWAIALGRTLDTRRDGPPSVSVGIISALGRVWGKAIQTDAKISPVNYGGPIIDLQGRVQGILIPASPRGGEETAGFEWYDSGIGFAIPFEDVMAVFPRLKQGKDLKKGLLGIRLKSDDIYEATPEVGQVTKDSTADRLGLKAGDVIVELDGHSIIRMAQIMHILGTKYEGDKISLKYKRGDKVIAVKDVELVGKLEVFAHGYLGILPMRDDPKLGVEIRHVFEGSPAAKAGLKAGDRIMKVGTDKKLVAFNGKKRGRDQFFDFLDTKAAGSEVSLEVKRAGGKTETVSITLGNLAKDAALPKKLPEKSSVGKALDPIETTIKNVKAPKIDKKARDEAEKGMLKRTTTTGEHKYWMYVPENYDPNVSHALLVWLHPPGKNRDADNELIANIWAEYCSKHHIILLGPLNDSDTGWIPGESAFVAEAIRNVTARYTIDQERIVVHGLGVGGQMGIYMGFNNRDLIRGVASIGAVPTNPEANAPSKRLAFFLTAGQLDPLVKQVAASEKTLAAKMYPVVFREIPNRGREYLNEAILAELVLWIETLDKQ